MITEIFIAENKFSGNQILFSNLDNAVEFVIATLDDNIEVFEVFAAWQLGKNVFNKRRIINESLAARVF